MSDVPDRTSNEAAEARAASAQLVQAIYRLAKACMLHEDLNQAVSAAIDGVLGAARDLCKRTGNDAATIVFAMDSVFVDGQVFRGSREVFALASELGELLEACDVSEVVIDKGITPQELTTFGRMLAMASRDKAVAKRLAAAPLPHLRARRVSGAEGGKLEGDSSPAARVVRTYASAVVIMRSFHADLRAGKLLHPQRLKRVAQKIVSHAESDGRHLVALAISSPTDPDAASIAVTTAVLAVAMARQLTSDRLVLAAIAGAALLFDAGRRRLLGGPRTDGGTLERALGDTEVERLPASEVVVATALGRINPASIARTVIAYEALSARRPSRPALYRGRRPPSIQARILTAARTFAELRVAVPGAAPISIDDAVELVLSRAADASERTYAKLLVGTLGIFPVGTLVELSTGELAVVTATPDLPVDFARPPVRIMYDANANLLDAPFDRDLAKPPLPGEPPRIVRRPIDADDKQMKAMRAYALSLSAERADAGPTRAGDSSSPPRREPVTATSTSRGETPRSAHEAPAPPVRERASTASRDVVSAGLRLRDAPRETVTRVSSRPDPRRDDAEAVPTRPHEPAARKPSGPFGWAMRRRSTAQMRAVRHAADRAVTPRVRIDVESEASSGRRTRPRGVEEPWSTPAEPPVTRIVAAGRRRGEIVEVRAPVRVRDARAEIDNLPPPPKPAHDAPKVDAAATPNDYDRLLAAYLAEDDPPPDGHT